MTVNAHTAVVITSIAAPNDVMRGIARGCVERGYGFWVIGDVPSPDDFAIEGCHFLTVDQQLATGLEYAKLCPTRHYARKNIGYLLAMRAGAGVLIDIDDDNAPRPEFWRMRQFDCEYPSIQGGGWINVYRYFTGENIWPRGLPLDAAATQPPDRATLARKHVYCPIQQGLADGDPDVDAIYRMLLPLPLDFHAAESVILERNSWCPFNSQNTAWSADAFPLMYLPAFCSFRMSDIWRSFVAQRICWENGWGVLFSAADVYQDRNAHNLMRDFADEVPGYLHNRRIADTLEKLALRSGAGALSANLLRCYEALVGIEVMPAKEIPLVEAWVAGLESSRRAAKP